MHGYILLTLQMCILRHSTDGKWRRETTLYTHLWSLSTTDCLFVKTESCLEDFLSELFLDWIFKLCHDTDKKEKAVQKVSRWSIILSLAGLHQKIQISAFYILSKYTGGKDTAASSSLRDETWNFLSNSLLYKKYWFKFILYCSIPSHVFYQIRTDIGPWKVHSTFASHIALNRSLLG